MFTENEALSSPDANLKYVASLSAAIAVLTAKVTASAVPSPASTTLTVEVHSSVPELSVLVPEV